MHTQKIDTKSYGVLTKDLLSNCKKQILTLNQISIKLPEFLGFSFS